jgi:hypothetical protein
MEFLLPIGFALFVVGLVAVVYVGLQRRARWVYVRFLDESGKPLVHEPLKGRFAQGGVDATYMGSVNDQPQYKYEAANEPDKVRPIGTTDARGCFRMRVVTSGCRAIELNRHVSMGGQTFAHYVIVQHISVEGGYPKKPFTVRLWKNGAALLPDSMLG